MLVAFEGLDCSGKTTTMNLLKSIEKKHKYIFCEEFSSPIGKGLKDLLINKGSFFLKTYYFATDRAWIYENVALPALNDNYIVIWDRYVDSALAYRKAEEDYANIIDYSFVIDINKPFMKPDLTVYFRIAPELSVDRAKKNNRTEPYNLDFLKKVYDFYEKRYEGDSSVLIVDALNDNEVICSRI